MGRFRASVAVMLLAGLGFAGAPAVYPTAVEAATDAVACPVQGVPATAFTDTVTSPHRAAIDCAAWWRLSTGRSATSFGPGDDITRGQTAAMAARLLRQTGAAPSDAPSAGFEDTRGHTFERDIDLLVHLDVLDGLTPTTFGPDQPIKRAQMATLIAQLFSAAYDFPLPEGSADFEDVAPGNVHRDAIQRLAAARITTGVTATTYAPMSPVSRAAMASFLTRSTTRLVAAGKAAPPTSVPAANDPFASKMRGAWVNIFEDTLKSRAGITRMLDELAAAGANAVIAQVIRRHDAYYDSDVLPRTVDPKLPADFDVLAELIPEARKRGIEVHAWFSIAPTWHGVYDSLPKPDGWLWKDHGRSAPEKDRWVTRQVTPDGYRWSDYLDLGLPEVQDHVAAVVGEIATRYDVDGIHLDYTRYESARHGYHPRAIQRYYAETGTKQWPSAGDRAWSDWRRKQSREIVVRARDAIRASGRDVTLSSAVITWSPGPPTPDRAGFQRTRAYNQVLQDWDGWARTGIIDAVFPMNYFRGDLTAQARDHELWLAHQGRLTADVAAKIVSGPAGYLNTPATTVDQVVNGLRRTNGAMVYSFNQPTKDGSRALWAQLARTRWGYSPARP